MKLLNLFLILLLSSWACASNELFGCFSVSPTQKVQFSKGNLKYNSSTKKYSFADQQYMYELTNAYLFDCNSVQNKYSIDGDSKNDWYVPTKDEFVYLFEGRENASQKVGIGVINGIKGLILLPDFWTLPNGLSFTSGTCSDYSSANQYSLEEWVKMEQNGAVFLPGAGTKQNSIIASATSPFGFIGVYWSTTEYSYGAKYVLSFYSKEIVPDNYWGHGASIRLVKSALCFSVQAEGTQGIVTGSGEYGYGATATLTATGNDNYTFQKWSDGNTDNPRTITVTQDTILVANFSPIIYHVEVLSADTTLGYVFGGGETTYNTEMQISAVCSQEGYHFTHWSDGSTVPGRKITVESDSTLIAYFAEDTPTECVTIDVNNPSLGSADIQIVATPASGATFINWSDGNTDNPRIVTDAPDNYIAVFVSTATNARATKASTNDHEKIIRDAQLYILRDGKTYNAQGSEVK